MSIQAGAGPAPSAVATDVVRLSGVTKVYHRDTLRIPVRYEIEPERIATANQAEDRGPIENARMLVRSRSYGIASITVKRGPQSVQVMNG